MDKIKVGDVFRTNEGGSVTVIEYTSNANILIKHNDKHGYVTRIRAWSLRRGHIKNPYHPSVCGVGFIGKGEYSSRENGKHSPAYTTWKSMLRRCYDPAFHERQPTYRGCEVDETWHNFQTFATWFDKQCRGDKWDIDKDLLVKDNKIYSPDTCRFVPSPINKLLLDRAAMRGDLPLGVKANYKGYMARLSVDREVINLGTYSTPEEAFRVYKKAKEDNIKRMANKYRDVLDPLIYESLMNYEVNP